MTGRHYVNTCGRNGLWVMPNQNGYCGDSQIRGVYGYYGGEKDDGCVLSGLGLLVFRLLNLSVPISELKPIRTNKK